MTALAQHLRRRTSSGNWMPELDGLRFVAIAAVLFFHMQGEIFHHGTHALQPRYATMFGVFDKGNRGVQLFFVISGYILARPFAGYHLFGGPKPSLRKYFLRRLTRLEPPYLLNLLACALSFYLLGEASARFVLLHLASSVVYMHYVFFQDRIAPLNSVAWSLEVEVQFYILAPLLTLVFAIHNPAARRLLLVISMIASAVAQTAFHLSPLTLAGELQYFLAGLLLADLSATTMKNWRHSRGWDLVSLAGWCLFFTQSRQYEGLWLPFLTCLLCVAAFRGSIVYRFLRLEWIAITGGMCYSIYLWHPLVLSAVQRVLDRLSARMPSDYGLYFLLQAVPKLLAVGLVSVFFYILVERPCMDPHWPRSLRNLLRRRLTQPSTAAPLVSLEKF